MDFKFKVKQITKLYESCNKCGLPTINCICSIVSKVETISKMWILSTEREFARPSNTARLMKLVNPESTELILWERTNPSRKLIEYISDKDYEIYVLFPTDKEDLSEKNLNIKNVKRK